LAQEYVHDITKKKNNQEYFAIHVFFIFFDLRGVSGPAYAHHDYSPRPTGHPASLGAGKAPRG